MMKFIKKIFSIENDTNFHKIITILGFKIKLLNTKKMVSKLRELEVYDNKYFIDADQYQPHCVDWFGSFKDYTLRNNMVDKIKLIKNGLDENSKFIIDLFLKRVMFLPDCSICNNFLLTNSVVNNLYTESEKKLKYEYEKLLPEIKSEFNLLDHKFLVETFFFHNGLYFCNKKQLDYIKNKDFIDGGAWIGDSVLVFEKYYTPRKTYSFEVSKKLAKQYKKVMELNGISNDRYELILAGLSDKKDTVYFNDGANTGTSVLSNGNANIDLISLDEFAKDRDLNVGFLKIDVEGCAYETVMGSKNIIQRDRPILSIAVYHSPHEFFDTKPLLEEITKGLNYKIEFKQMQYKAYLAIEYVIFAYPAELSS